MVKLRYCGTLGVDTAISIAHGEYDDCCDKIETCNLPPELVALLEILEPKKPLTFIRRDWI